MSKEVTKENLRAYAEEHLESTSTMVSAGMMDAKTAKGHIDELFYLSGTFGLDLQEKAREITKRMEGK